LKKIDLFVHEGVDEFWFGRKGEGGFLGVEKVLLIICFPFFLRSIQAARGAGQGGGGVGREVVGGRKIEEESVTPPSAERGEKPTTDNNRFTTQQHSLHNTTDSIHFMSASCGSRVVVAGLFNTSTRDVLF